MIILTTTASTNPFGLSEILQIIIAVLQLIIAVFLGCLAYTSYKRDVSKMHIEMYDAIEQLEEKYVAAKAYNDANSDIIENIQEHICNRYEILCYEYLNNRIDKKMFEEMYYPSIKQLIDGGEYNDFYSENGKYNVFDNTIKVNKKLRICKE